MVFDELVMIMERRRAVGHIVCPIFFHVDPSEVSELSGGYAAALADHEKCFQEEMTRVDGWRAAIKELAGLGGFVLQDRYESQFIRNIVKEIRNKLNHTVLNVPSYLVGIDFDIIRIYTWLQDESTNLSVLILYGVGGIGKTTIAKTVYNMNYDSFEGGSFLPNIRENSEQPNGLLHIQRQLLADILKEKPNKIYNIDEGIVKVMNAICRKKVLIVLDDVDEIDQFRTVIGLEKSLFHGSKIIITTRNAGFGVNYERFFLINIVELDKILSLNLFSWHCFGQNHPPENFLKFSKSIVNYCGGLPLALQVLGSSLRGKGAFIWESALRKLEEIPDAKIQKILRISYDSLQDDHDKSLFLDIACFFVGKDKDYVVKILDDCGFYTIIGLQNLIDRCLITINERNQIMMHQLLRDMGREIVRLESPEDPGKRSRLWSYKDTITVLKENTTTETVKAVALNPSVSEDETNQVDLETAAFAKMHRLKLLKLCNVRLKGDYADFPRTLIWLSWRGFSSKSIPPNLCFEKLAVLDMRCSKLKCLWNRIRNLPNLKILNLSHSHFLVTTPNFKGLLNLERLILKDCINLVEIDESIEVLERILLLNLKDCKNLKKLPSKITRLKSLEELVLFGCMKLNKIPKELEEMNLTALVVDGIVINQIHSASSKGKSKKLRFKSSDSCFSPRKGSKSLTFSFSSLPRSLATLSLANCNLSDNHIPNDLTLLPSLQQLNLGGNPIHALPESIKNLTLLHSLLLEHCGGLESLPELPSSLKELNVNQCTSLERIKNLPNFHRKLNFRSHGYENLVEVEGAFKLQPQRNIDRKMINALGLFDSESLPSFHQAKMVNLLTGTFRTTSVQVLSECGIFSIYIPGNEIPKSYTHRNEGYSLSFRINRLEGYKIIGLNLCVVYAFYSNPQSKIFDMPFVSIDSKPNGLVLNYSPTFYEIPADHTCHLWLSHWKFVDELEDGNEVSVRVSMPPGIEVKRVGIHFAYEEEIELNNHSQSLITSSPWYQVL